jgi:hypothetical protein
LIATGTAGFGSRLAIIKIREEFGDSRNLVEFGDHPTADW